MKRLIVLLLIVTGIYFYFFERGVQDELFVEVNGSQQFVTVEAAKRGLPVLVHLHWGPGLAQSPVSYEYDRHLVKHFTVVHWDQRGAGKSAGALTDASQWSLEQFKADAVEVIRWALETYGQDKVVLVGHSWGSLVGIHVAHEFPELIEAYVGVGQIVNILAGEQISYNFVMEEAQKRGLTEAVDGLKAIGNPPYPRPQDWGFQRSLLHDFGGYMHAKSFQEFQAWQGQVIAESPMYTEADVKAYFDNYMASVMGLMGVIIPTDISGTLTSFDVPMYFFLGRHDYTVPSEVAEAYFGVISAPQKEIIWFEESGHLPNMEEPEAYSQALIRLL